MIRRIIFIVTMGLMLSGINASAGDSGKDAAAVSVAEKWLAMVDSEKYVESWQEASEILRIAVQPKQWEQAMQAVRRPLGRVLSRKVKTKVYTTTLPGAPDGEYVVIQFESSFENKKTAVETVTPMLDKDGVWRVSGYYIK